MLPGNARDAGSNTSAACEVDMPGMYRMKANAAMIDKVDEYHPKTTGLPNLVAIADPFIASEWLAGSHCRDGAYTSHSRTLTSHEDPRRSLPPISAHPPA